mgnify:CR=1 FL=1
MPFEYQVSLIYAAVNGYFDNIPKEEIGTVDEKLTQYFKNFHPEIIKEISQVEYLTKEIE